ncbi:helix-turn-helix transcriptional regulator [Pseudophaeobacter sp.]|jgi:transcriptional regulator with XRE-family HTH domain|uniref:helix-turn-helix domain-containing protein n=1 Tax=Pseudophaeobacter sp. TaxID=1971739 RepID=UPI0032D90C87
MAKTKRELSPEASRQIENARINMRIAIALSSYSETGLSEAAGMSPNVLGKFCRGETMINLANIISACEVLGMPLSLIVSDRELSPARIRLAKLVDRLDEADLAAFMESERK